MYVVDITRDNYETDILCGKDSMDAKNKTLNYIMDYAMANYDLNLDKDILDYKLDMDMFSLKNFLSENYSIQIDDDLITQSIVTDKEHCLFLKYIDDKTDVPIFCNFGKKDIKKAQSYMKYLINESLIEKFQDNLTEYEKLKLDYDKEDIITSTSYPNLNIKSEIISLYKDGLFLDELLDKTNSLRQLNVFNDLELKL